jgi:hypothetical protein
MSLQVPTIAAAMTIVSTLQNVAVISFVVI